jgi:hypothetical protein
MQDLWHRGPHPRALTGRKHDGQAGSSVHPNPWLVRADVAPPPS